MMCVHCHKRKASRPRGLCWRCFYTPGVKDRFPSTSKYARRAANDAATATAKPPPGPRPAEVSAEEHERRLQAIESRAAARLPLFEDGDPVIATTPNCCFACGDPAKASHNAGGKIPSETVLEWASRRVTISGNAQTELLCPECWWAYGWHQIDAFAVIQGRADDSLGGSDVA